MAKYMFDAGRWTPAESWRTIRTARADPPERFASVLKGERMVIFQTALEQAQQQFTAATSVGYESRPLNLFYGISQAGRALAAASPELYARHPDEKNRRWQSSSHGLEFTPSGSLGDFWKQVMSVKPSKGDTFSRTSAALSSPYEDVGTVELGSLATQFPQFLMEWRSFGGWPHALSDGDSSRLTGSPPHFVLREFKGDPTVEAIRSYTSPYPALRDLTIRVDDVGIPLLDSSGDVSVLVEDELIEGREYRKHLRASASYLGSRYVLPAAGRSHRALHPLMSWWLVLYSFSMLARYHPKEWTEALTLTASPVASQVEFLLDVAVTTVPEMLARELWDEPAG